MTDDAPNELDAAIFEFMGVIGVLLYDVQLNIDLQKQTNNPAVQQFYRRAFIRSAFAMIEGALYRMKQTALQVHTFRKPVFTQGELDMLAEKTYKLTNSGAVQEEAARISLRSNIRFTFKAVARITQVKYELDMTGIGWQRFDRSINVRDRLMHPKTSEQLEISNQEYADALAGWAWFTDSMHKAFAGGRDHPT